MTTTKIIRSALLLTIALLATNIFAQESAAIRLNRAIELLDNDQTAFGILSADLSPENARSLARSGLDFVIIDMEHNPFDVAAMRLFLLAMTDKRAIMQKGNLQPDVVPLIRIPASSADGILQQAKQVLDAGVFGVMYPSINTREEAEMAVGATRYPQLRGAPDRRPTGLRGRAPTNATWYWGVDDYVNRADVWPLDPDGELLAIIQIETPEAVANIDDILSVPGIGVIFIGPSDLSTAMGYASPAAPEVESAIQTVLAACKGHDVPCAITTGAGNVEQRVREGFRFVTVGSDGGLATGTSNALRLGRDAAAQ